MQYSGYSNIVKESWSIYPSSLATLLQEAGLLANFDAIWLFARTREKANYLIELKGTGNDGVIVGGTVFFDDEYGVYSDGRGYIDLNHKSQTDAISFALDAGSIGYFLVDEIKDNSSILGTQDGANNIIAGSGKIANSSRLNMWLNNSTVSYKAVTKGYGLPVINRDGNNLELFFDGVSLGTYLKNHIAIPDTNLFGLTVNSNGVAPDTDDISWNRLGMIFIAGKWTAPQVASLNTIFNDYFTKIGTTNRLLHRTTAEIEYKREQYIVIDQRADYILARDQGKLMFSDDNGETWTDYIFADADVITDGYIWANGNINFATLTKFYFSDDGLVTASELTVYEPDGITPMTVHIPVNADFPGTYFRTIGSAQPMEIGGNEVRVFGNYGQQWKGANPTHIYYNYNNGANIKIVYKLGQNPYYTDDGSSNGGVGGNLLGDATNPLWVRHIHAMTQIPGTNRFIFTCGDDIQIEQSELKWFKIEYDESLDTWTTTLLYASLGDNRYKAVGLCYADGYLWWGSDDDAPGGDLGIFKCLEEDIPVYANHIKMADSDGTMLGLLITDGELIACKEEVGGERFPLIISKNLTDFTLVELINIPGFSTWSFNLSKKNADGFYKLSPYAMNGGSNGADYFYPSHKVKIL